ncbi:antiviral reverse transcriptase Drt2 [Vibrio sp. nBUS_14]|uniref:antiviral reverse transcriptase Drt2 n=1 Tax=Vibrio sp. nBUS_14 TaxID=3395321 RepID=UPI003EBCE9CA
MKPDNWFDQLVKAQEDATERPLIPFLLGFARTHSMTHKKSSQWYTKRNYLHFDQSVSEVKAQRIVMNKKVVSTHAFFPFISYTFNTSKLARDVATDKLYQKPKPRSVAYSSHIDSHIYAYYAQLLSERYEEALKQKGLEENVLAFRKIDGKSNIHFANDAFNDIRLFGTGHSAVALDFSKFFNTLDHQLLKLSWCEVLKVSQLPSDHYNVFRSLTKYSEADRNALFSMFDISPYNPKAQDSQGKKRKQICSISDFRSKVRKNGLIQTNRSGEGIPQGSPISALLSNIYMLSFDEKMRDFVACHGGKYYRYCDDMLFIVPTSIRSDVEQFAIQEIGSLKVQINKDKTEIRDFKLSDNVLTSFDEHGQKKTLQYLGFLFDGNSIYLRSTALARYSEKMKGGVKLAKDTRDKENRIRKTKGEPKQDRLYRKKLHRLYSYRGKRNFLSYGYRAAKIMDNSSSIKKQLKPLWGRLQEEIAK